MPQNISGTFVSTSGPNRVQISEVLTVPTSATTGHRQGILNISGDIDANNTVTLERTINNGVTWGGVLGPLTSPQTNVAYLLAQASGSWQYRITCSMTQPGKTIQYSLSAES